MRAWYMEVYFASDDPYWKAAVLWVIVSVEGNFGIVCGCLPTLKPLAKMLFPRFFASRSDLAAQDKSIELAERDDSVNSEEGGEAVAGFPFGNISNPGRDRNGTVSEVEIEQVEPRADIQGRRIRRDDEVWAEVDTTLPAGGFKVLQTMALHGSRRNSTQLTASTGSIEDDSNSENHILRPWTGWSKEC